MVSVVFDFSEKVDDFIEKQAPLRAIMFDYYLNFIPYFANLFSPLFIFIAVIFFTSRMASNTEIVAILSSGVGFPRLLRPYMLSALVLASTSFVLNNWVIPPANAKRLAFEDIYIHDPFYFSGKNIHRQISPGTFIYFESYNAQVDIGHRFTLEKIEHEQLTFKLSGDFARWDTTRNLWTVENFREHIFDGTHETLREGSRLDTVFDFFPGDFKMRDNNVETMDYGALNSFINEEKMRGSSKVEIYEVEKYKRMVFPFATFILTALAVALASRKVRGGIGLHIGLGMLIGFTYILFMQVFTTFAIQGGIPPMIAVWIPNVIYGLLALTLLRLAPK